MVDKQPAQKYVNKIKNRFAFNIKCGCYFELLTPEIMKLLGSDICSLQYRQ